MKVNDEIEEDLAYEMGSQVVNGHTTIKGFSSTYGYTMDQIKTVVNFVKISAVQMYVDAMKKDMTLENSESTIEAIAKKFDFEFPKLVLMLQEEICKCAKIAGYSDNVVTSVAMLSNLLGMSKYAEMDEDY